MFQAFINANVTRYKEEIDALLGDLATFCHHRGQGKYGRIVEVQRNKLDQPFLFVVVGEVKAGKSSFVNALLGEVICRVAEDPCTAKVQKISYGPNTEPQNLSDHVQVVQYPLEILQKIAIVDTPGTNSIIRHHQEITENFMPESDLVIFVFPANNPYHETAWKLLDLANDTWRKKVVFVLQQCDLATRRQVEVSRSSVITEATRRGIDTPVVFATSAVLVDDPEREDGFDAVRDFIRETVTGRQHVTIKIRGILDVVRKVVEETLAGLAAEEAQLKIDEEQVANIRTTIQDIHAETERDFARLQERVMAAYTRKSRELVKDVGDRLSIGRMLKHPLENRNLKQDIEDKVNKFRDRVESDINAIVLEELNHANERIVKLIDQLMARIEKNIQQIERVQVDEHKQTLVDEIKERIRRMLEKELFGHNWQPESLSSVGIKMVGGGLLGAVGLAVLAVTQVTIIDVTGGIVTLIGGLFAGGSLLFVGRRVVTKVQEELDQSELTLNADLKDKLAAWIRHLQNNIADPFVPMLRDVEKRRGTIGPDLQIAGVLQQRLHKLQCNIPGQKK